MASLATALGVSALLAAAVLAQTPPPPPPPQQPGATFKSSVDLVPVDVNVVDNTGRPIENLTAADFALSVDGKPRRIASAQFISLARNVEPAPAVKHYSSNAQAAGGRLIMIVIDQGNIQAGGGKGAIDAASRFVGRLHKSDRVSLFVIPGAGPQMDFTSNHALVQTLLKRVVGQATETLGPKRIGVAEALAINRGETQAMNEVLDRECAGLRDPAEIAFCRTQIAAEAATTYADARTRTQSSLVALRYLMERLAQSSVPKTVVFISEALVIDRDYSELSWLGPLAARAQVTIYPLMLHPRTFDASSSSVSPTRGADIAMGEEGLGLIASLARGSVFRVVGNADFAFNRLALELSGYYLLSFEPEPGDRDAKSHKIKIEVPGRRGIEVRSRREFTVDPARSKTDEELLVETLRAPLLANDIGLKVATYVFRDPASPKLRIILAAEIDRTLNPQGNIALGYVLVDSKAKLIDSTVEPHVTTPVRAVTRTQTYTSAAVAESAGVYTLKLAVIDETGKRGSVEHSFRAQLTSAGQIRATDLLIAESAAAPGGLTPAVSADFASHTLHGYIELYSDSVEALNTATVMMEVAEDENGRPLDSGAARFQDRQDSASTRRVAEAAVPIALLPPGDYVARAVISIGGRTSGQVIRPFRIARSAGTVARDESPVNAPKGAAPIPFASRIDAFERGAVLAPPVVGFFLNRMNVGSGAGRSAAPAVEHARAGRFDEAVAALTSTGNDQLATVFLGGLALYAKGDLEAAAVKFRETLRIDSEFFPAAFYLGACYAAGGRDRDAVGAWQTSLVTEGDAPFVYTLLGDALLRLRDVDAAIDILTEASSIWPDNDEVRLRLGTALAMGGKPAEAIKLLDPYLATHPQDHERYFVALRALYEARAAGKSIGTPDEDRQRFDRYAAAYAAANGPQQALVDQWKRFMEKR